uniref:Uncharacterized protein n=2 Tax=Sus scrofa TaxID=9823 RepID=A0A4X1VE46_PIG|nr:lymphocyte antigen 6 complex locus G6E [Sus scrofa]
MGTSSIFLCLLFLGGALGKGGLGNPWGLVTLLRSAAPLL